MFSSIRPLRLLSLRQINKATTKRIDGLKTTTSTTTSKLNALRNLNTNTIRTIHTSKLSPQEEKKITQLNDLMSNQEFFPNQSDDDVGIPTVQFEILLNELRQTPELTEQLIASFNKLSFKQLQTINSLLDQIESGMSTKASEEEMRYAKDVLDLGDEKLASDILKQGDNYAQLKRYMESEHDIDSSVSREDQLREFEQKHLVGLDDVQGQTEENIQLGIPKRKETKIVEEENTKEDEEEFDEEEEEKGEGKDVNEEDDDEEEEFGDEDLDQMDRAELEKMLEDEEEGTGIQFGGGGFSRKNFIPELLYREWIHKVASTYTFISSKTREQLFMLHRMDPNKYTVHFLAEKVMISPERVAAIIDLKRAEKEEERKRGTPLDYTFDIDWDMFHNVFPDDPPQDFIDEPIEDKSNIPEYPRYGFGDAELPENEFVYTSLRRAQRVPFPEKAPAGYHEESIVLFEPTMTKEQENLLRERKNPENDGEHVWSVKGVFGEYDRPTYVRALNGSVRTANWSDYHNRFAGRTELSFIMQMQQRMLPHYIVAPNQYSLKPSDEWLEDESSSTTKSATQ